MKTMLGTFYAKPLSIYLALALLAITTFAGPAEAMFVASAPGQDASAPAAAPADRAADLARVQTALESKVIQQTLMDYGLSPEETMARMNKLSDEQISQFASHTESLQAGGDGGVSLLLILLIVLLIIVIAQAPGQTDAASA
ncbi:MAG: PA2779 family protein [Nitrospirota bacterium]